MRAADPAAAELVERFAEAWSREDPEAFLPLFHPDVHLIQPLDGDAHGVAEARAFMERTMALIPDLRYRLLRPPRDRGDTDPAPEGLAALPALAAAPRLSEALHNDPLS